MTEPAWVREARKYIGVREIKGVNHHPLIVGWWRAIKRSGIKTDEVPWCAAFVGAMLEAVDIVSSRYESAKSYLTWGQKLDAPVLGCIAVFTRDGGGHVGFVVGRDTSGNLLILGGNQSDTVSIRAFSRLRLSDLRWPNGVPVPLETLPVLASRQVSTKES